MFRALTAVALIATTMAEVLPYATTEKFSDDVMEVKILAYNTNVCNDTESYTEYVFGYGTCMAAFGVSFIATIIPLNQCDASSTHVLNVSVWSTGNCQGETPATQEVMANTCAAFEGISFNVLVENVPQTQLCPTVNRIANATTGNLTVAAFAGTESCSGSPAMTFSHSIDFPTPIPLSSLSFNCFEVTEDDLTVYVTHGYTCVNSNTLVAAVAAFTDNQCTVPYTGPIDSVAAASSRCYGYTNQTSGEPFSARVITGAALVDGVCFLVDLQERTGLSIETVRLNPLTVSDMKVQFPASAAVIDSLTSAGETAAVSALVLAFGVVLAML